MFVNAYTSKKIARTMPLLALIAVFSIIAAGCAVSSNTALPELPPAPSRSTGTFTINDNLVACPAGSTPANPLAQLCAIPTATGTIDVVADAFLGSPYSATILTRGGVLPVTSCQIQGTIPAGITLNAAPSGANCVITGTLQSPLPSLTIPPGGFVTLQLTVRATDSGNPANADTQDIVIRIFAGFSFTTPLLENGTQGRAFAKTVVSNLGGGIGVPPMTLCTATGLPAGLSVAVAGNNCSITGTPTVNGTFSSVVITGTDSAANTRSSSTYTLRINPPLTVAAPTLTNGTVGRPYTVTAGATATTAGGERPITACSATGLPPGLTVARNAANTACEVSGTPTTAGTFSTVIISATDSSTPTTLAGTSAAAATIIVVNPALTVPAFVIGNSTEGRAFALTVPTAGGNRPLTACSLAAAPAGLVVAPDPANTAANVNNCLVTGTPAVGSAGSFNLTVTATDTATANTVAGSGSSAATALLNNAVLAVPIFTFQTGAENVTFTDTIPTTGGNRPLVTCTATGLAAGLLIAPDPANTAANVNNCIVSGTPTAGSAGPYTVMVNVTDTASTTTAAGNAASANTALTINGPLTIPPFVLGNGTQTRAFSQNIPVTGGIQPITICTTLAALPAGLSIAVNGGANGCVITGTPTVSGAFSVTVQATDTGAPPGTPPAIATSAATPLTINAPLVVPAVVYGAGTEGRPFTQTITVTGGEQPLTSCSMAGIPAAVGLVIALGPGPNQCTLSGTPAATTAGNYTVTVSVTDTATTSTAVGTVSNAPGNSLTINPPLAVTSIVLLTSVDSRAVLPILVPITGGQQPYASCTLNQLSVIAGAGTSIGAGSTLSTAVVGTNCRITGSIAAGASGSTLPVAPPTESTVYRIDVAATDSLTTSTAAGTANSPSMTWQINEPLAKVPVSGVLGDGVVTRPFSQSYSVVGGVGGVAFSVQAGPFTPAGSNWIGNAATPCEGLTLNGLGGTLTGIPVNAGTAPGCDFTNRLTDAGNANTPAGFEDTVTTIDIQPALTIPAVVWGNGTDTRAFTQTFTVTGGIAPLLACNVLVPGTLPSGLTLALGPGTRDCTLSGTPPAGTSAGSPFNFTLTVSDSPSSTTASGNTIGPAMNVVINPPVTITTVVIAPSVSGRAITAFSVPISGGQTPYTGCSVAAGAGSGGGTLGAGTTLTGAVVGTNCVLSGAISAAASPSVNPPTAADDSQNYTITVSATDTATTSTAAGGGTSAGMPWLINEAIDGRPLSGTTLGDGVVNRAFSVQIDGNGGIPGNLFGTLTAGNFTQGPPNFFTGNPGTACQGLTIDGQPLSPTGGLISGTPTFAAGGACNFTVRINDIANGNTPAGFLDLSYTLTIRTALTVNSVALATGTADAGTQGRAFSKTYTRTGGTGAFTWSITGAQFAANVGIAGTPCEGLSIASATGILSGTPPNAGTPGTCGPFVVQVDDTGSTTPSSSQPNTTAAGNANQNQNVTINDNLTITPISVGDGTTGRNFSETINFAGGNSTFTCSQTGLQGNLAVGTVGSTCTITATPLAGGVGGPYNANITVTDTASSTTVAGNASTGAMPYSINAVLNITTITLPGGVTGSGYTQTVLAAGGNGAGGYTFSEVAGSALANDADCAGLTFSALGGVTGTPTAAGPVTCSFTVRVDDTATSSTGAGFDTQALTISIVAPVSLAASPALNVDFAGNGTEGIPFGPGGTVGQVDFAITGGSGSFFCSVTAGALPSGLSVAFFGGTTSCRISGTPAPGSNVFNSYQAEITVTDTGVSPNQTSAQITAQFDINPPLAIQSLTSGSGTVPDAVQARSYSFLISTAGGETPRFLTNPAGTLATLNTGDNDCDGLFLDTAIDTITGTGSSPTGSPACPFSLNLAGTQTTTTAAGSLTIPFSYTLQPVLQIATTQSSIVNGLVGAAHPGVTFTATGGTGTYTWSQPAAPGATCGALTGAIPTSMTLGALTGILGGTPTVASTAVTDFQFQICVEDNTGGTNTAVPAGSAIPPANPIGGVGNAYRLNVMSRYVYATDNSNNDSLHVIDSTNNTEVDTIAGGGTDAINATAGVGGVTDPRQVVVSLHGRYVWVTLQAGQHVNVFDTITHANVAALDVNTGGLSCNTPQGIAIQRTAQGDRVAVACTNGHVIILNDPGPTATPVVTGATDLTLTSCTGSLNSIAFNATGSRAFVTDNTNNLLCSIDTSAVAPVQVDLNGATGGTGLSLASNGSTPRGIVVVTNGANQYAYVAQGTASGGGPTSFVQVVDVTPVAPTTATIVTSLNVGAGTQGPRFLAYDSTNDIVYLTREAGNSLLQINNTSPTPTVAGAGSVATTAAPFGVAIAPVSGKVFVGSNTSDVVDVFNLTTFGVNPTASAPTPVAMSGGSTTTVRGMAAIQVPR